MLNAKEKSLFKGFGITSIVLVSLMEIVLFFVSYSNLYYMLLVDGILAIIFTSIALKYKTRKIVIISYITNIIMGILGPSFVATFIYAFIVTPDLTSVLDGLNIVIIMFLFILSVFSFFLLIANTILLGQLIARPHNENEVEEVKEKKVNESEYDELNVLHELLAQGIITQEEYDEKKGKYLNK